MQTGPMVLVHSAAGAGIAALLQATRPGRFAAILLAPDGGERISDAWRAPFPDRGYQAALRALGPIASSSGPSAEQAASLARQARNAMGYSAA
jgi:tRNA(adenine34) deaminase